jgi:hypothetical protein
MENKYKAWLTEISDKELNVNFTNISSCCRGKQKTSYGYIWKFKN